MYPDLRIMDNDNLIYYSPAATSEMLEKSKISTEHYIEYIENICKVERVFKDVFYPYTKGYKENQTVTAIEDEFINNLYTAYRDLRRLVNQIIDIIDGYSNNGELEMPDADIFSGYDGYPENDDQKNEWDGYRSRWGELPPEGNDSENNQSETTDEQPTENKNTSPQSDKSSNN